MFLRRHCRKKGEEAYEYWTLVESVRTAAGPRQRIVAALGKLSGQNEQARVGWEHIRDVLDGRLAPPDLFTSETEPPQWATVDTSRARVERLRRFGEVYLGLALWRRLKLDVFFGGVIEEGREEIAWGTMACILVLARFCAPSSELQIAEFWYGKTALDDLLGVAREKVNDDRLYRALDALLPHKDALFGHFQTVYGELFGTTFDVLLYDDNLDLLRESKAKYLVGTPKSKLKQFEQDLLEQDWEHVEADVEVKLRPSPDDENETFVLCRSRGRIEKERAMREKQRGRMETELNTLKTRIDAEQRALRNLSTAERRVGRLSQQYPRAARFFQVNISECDDPKHKSGKRLTITIDQKDEHREWEEMAEIRSLDIVLPTGADKDIRLRTVSKPEQHLAILLQKLELPLPDKPKSI